MRERKTGGGFRECQQHRHGPASVGVWGKEKAGPCRPPSWTRRPDLITRIFRGRSCDIFERFAKGTQAWAHVFSAKARFMMRYRDIEYTVVQGIEHGVWKWSASVAGAVIKGHAAIKSEAVVAAEKAIDRALAAKDVRSSRPKKTGCDVANIPATDMEGGPPRRRV
jgi:hypothetical protein